MQTINTETVTILDYCGDILSGYQDLTVGLVETVVMETILELGAGYEFMFEWIDNKVIDWNYILNKVNH